MQGSSACDLFITRDYLFMQLGRSLPRYSGHYFGYIFFPQKSLRKAVVYQHALTLIDICLGLGFPKGDLESRI